MKRFPEESEGRSSAMEELAPSDLARILPLVPPHDEAGHMTFVHSVIDGRMPGRVLVDERADPRTALVLTASGFHFAIGRPDAALVDAVVPELLAGEGRNEPAALWTTSRAWEGALDHIFVARSTRKEFKRDTGREPTSVRPLPAECRLVPLDAAIAARLGDTTDDWLLRAWGGVASFVAHAFGVAVLQGDEIASFCAACAIGDGEAEVEVETAPRRRRQGLATHAALGFFADCRRRGLRPAWTCGSNNRPSDHLARRLGFRPVRYVVGYPLRPGMERHDGRWLLPVRQVRRRRRR